MLMPLNTRDTYQYASEGNSAKYFNKVTDSELVVSIKKELNVLMNLSSQLQ